MARMKPCPFEGLGGSLRGVAVGALEGGPW
jgi:hypothetical protein